MATFTGTTGSDTFTGTDASDTFSTGGSGVDRFIDTAGGNDKYNIFRADDRAFFEGQVFVEDTGSGGDIIDLTDFVRGGAASLAFRAVGDTLADLEITSGDNQLVLAGQLVAGTSGVETIQYNGRSFTVADRETLETFSEALRNIVSADNRPPVSLGPASLSLSEDGGQVSLDLARFVADQDLDPLSFAIKGQPSNGTASISGSTFRFTPRPDADEDDTIQVEAVSNGGRITIPVSIDLQPVNDAPRQDDATVALAAGKTTRIDLLDRAVDVEGDRISLVSVLPGPSTTLGDFQILEDRTLVFTPREGASGGVDLAVQIRDEADARSTSTLRLTLVEENIAPRGNGQQARITVEEDGGTHTLDLREFVTDPNGDTLSFLKLGDTDLGNATINNEGILSFTPTVNEFGTDTLRFRVSDGALTFDSDVVLEVAAVNDAPLAEADEATLGADDKSVVIDVLANDSDPERDKLSVTSVSSSDVEILSNGRLSFAKALPREDGTETFSYTVEDGKGGTATAEVTVTIEGAGQAGGPDARDDRFAGKTEARLLRGFKLDILKNDVSELGKKGLDRTSIEILDLPDHGDFSIAGGKIRYQADQSFDGEDSFTYTVADVQGRISDIATVVITGPDLT